MQDGPSQYTTFATDLKIASVAASANNAYAYRANDSRTATAWTSGAATKPTFRAVLAASTSLASMRMVMTPGIPVTVDAHAATRPFRGVVRLDGGVEPTMTRLRILLGADVRRSGKGWVIAGP